MKKTEFFPFLSLVFKWDKASIVNECEQRFRRPPTWNSNSKIPCHNAGIWEISVNCHSENNSLFLHCQYGTPPTRPTPPRRPKLYIFICHVPMPEFIFLCICMCTGRWNCYFLFFCLFYRHSALPSNLTRFCTCPAGVLRKCRIQKPKKTILHIKWAFRVGKVGQVNNYVNGSSFGPCDRPTAVAFIFGTLHWKYFAIFSHWFAPPLIIFLFFFFFFAHHYWSFNRFGQACPKQFKFEIVALWAVNKITNWRLKS